MKTLGVVIAWLWCAILILVIVRILVDIMLTLGWVGPLAAVRRAAEKMAQRTGTVVEVKSTNTGHKTY